MWRCDWIPFLKRVEVKGEENGLSISINEYYRYISMIHLKISVGLDDDEIYQPQVGFV